MIFKTATDAVSIRYMLARLSIRDLAIQRQGRPMFAVTPIVAISSAYSTSSSARAMRFTNGHILICVNAVARRHKRDVLATPQQVEIKRRVKCECDITFLQ